MGRTKLVRALMVFVVLNLGASLLAAAPASATNTTEGGGGSCSVFVCGQDGKPAGTGKGNCIAGSLYIFSTHQCIADNDDLENAISTQSSTGVHAISTFAKELNELAVGMVAGLANWILTDELGSKNSFNSPKIICTSCADGNSWFLGQLAVIRSIGLYFIIPLLMLVVIQSVVKGSLFFLLRAVVIMLPVAVIGSVILVSLAQLFEDIADDMSSAIATYTTSIDGYGEALKASVNKVTGFGLFFWFWLFIFAMGALAIFVELVLRQIGVYLTVLFLPLAFSALVWPPATKYARRLVEVLLGLIFSKVFIVGAFSLGIAAFAHISPPGPGGSTDSSNVSAAASVMTGSVVMLMSAFAGAKILSFTPAAIGSAEGYVMKRQNLTNRGTWAQGRLSKIHQRQQRRLNSIEPSKPWSNSAPESTPSGSKSPPNPQPVPAGGGPQPVPVGGGRGPRPGSGPGGKHRGKPGGNRTPKPPPGGRKRR